MIIQTWTWLCSITSASLLQAYLDGRLEIRPDLVVYTDCLFLVDVEGAPLSSPVLVGCESFHLLPHLTRFWNTFKNIVKIIAKRIYSLCFSININANLLSCPRGACRVEKWHEVPKILFFWRGPPPPDSILSSETFPATDTPKELFKRSFYSNQCARQLNEVRSFQVFYDEVFLILGKEDFGNLLSLLIFYLRNLNLNWQQLQWKELSKSYTVVTTNEGDEPSVLWWWGAWLCRHRHVKRNTQQNRQQAKKYKGHV